MSEKASRDPGESADAGSAPQADHPAEPLHQRFRTGRSPWVRLWVIWAGLIVVAIVAAWMLMRPAPPKRIVITTASKTSPYYKLARQYADVFAANGITLEVRESPGTVENYRLLEEGTGANDKAGASLAIVAGGQAPKNLKVGLHSIASLYLEPVWVFCRGETDDRLAALAGKRVAIGAPGGGGRAVALQLLRANGLAGEEGETTGPATATATATATAAGPTSAPASGPAPETRPGVPPAAPAVLSPLGGRAAADALKAGQIDAAFFISAPDSPLIKELLAAERSHGIRLMSFERHEAYARLFPYLSDVKLPRGVVDLALDLPGRDTYLLAPAANLIARQDLHPSLVPLLLTAVSGATPPRALLSTSVKFPNTEFGEFPLDPAAREYFRSGSPLLQRYLPFWVASLLDRTKILLLPLITLLLPLARLAPPLYVWNIRSRIYKWYRVLRHVDQRLRDAKPSEAPAAAGAFDPEVRLLDEMDREVAGVNVPLAYMSEFYTLRQHADFLRQEIEKRTGAKEGETAKNTEGSARNPE